MRFLRVFCLCVYMYIWANKKCQKRKQFPNISSVKAGSRSQSDQEIIDSLPPPIYHL